MIEKMPLDIEPPSPIPFPPLRKRPFISPQFSTTAPYYADLLRSLFVD
ncbi:MAG: hypothetical protein LBI79_06695 [Nitrososphaerota archaeon]|nr:hypothetical protein [Nitrososphaerota archaeon]